MQEREKVRSPCSLGLRSKVGHRPPGGGVAVLGDWYQERRQKFGVREYTANGQKFIFS